LAYVAQSPKDNGELKLIVRRPADGEREVLQEGRLDLEVGLVGDNWKTRGSTKTPDVQPTLINKSQSPTFA
jgi:hypothetical protein